MAELEAILLLAREPLGTRKLAQLAGLADGTEARTLIRALNQLYDAEGSAFRVEEVAGGLQLMSRPKFAPWLRRLQPVPVEVRLSPPTMETLAVVAYRQPILRAQIEAIRGVQCGEILRQLMERDLVRIVGRSEDLGRPFLYGTTRQFLQTFGLRHLDELPRAEWLRAGSPAGPAAAPLESHITANQDSNREDQDQEANVKAPTIQPAPRSGAKTPKGQSTRRTTDEMFDMPQQLEAFDEDEDEELEDDDDEDLDEDDEDDLDEEDEDEDLDDEDFEDDDWEEVDDDDEEDLDEEEDDEDEWEDDDDDDWDDDDDDDWDDDDEEEEGGEEEA